RYDGSTFTSYYKSDGLIADNITDIVEDQQNNMYFSSLYGVSKVDDSYLGSEIQTKKEIELYPNPAKDNITISSFAEIIKIELYSPSGQLLRKINSHQKQETIDVSDLAPGNYFIRTIGREDVWVKKFVVVR
ncbi:MAG: T9SS type A sorting domain-containing protein, partial [Bacteroidales bacterium]|nr:T9SS type A sorting domain-containing protein [Bacteroidales bacterium]MCF8459081.1 T9SS type A sorting domain-containing protein [Bacteroidales bacterium]